MGKQGGSVANPAPESGRMFRAGELVSLKESIAPDLWRIFDIEGRVAQLEPVSLGATRRQTPVSDLRRYRIKTTDQVFWNERLAEVQRVLNPRSDDLYEYEVAVEGRTTTLREHELTVHVGSAAPDPLSQLLNLDAAPAAMACARTELLHAYFEATARSLGIAGYNGARMLPIPHQISAARYALLFGRPRFLLADEVGLGKTVEAGLIVSTLRKYFPEWRAGFFVPESLTVQWAFEMYGKFGKSIYRVDEDAELDEGDDDPGVILPHARALAWKSRAPVGILVIDEAHQVLRDPALYSAFIELSRRAHAVLLLTATPSSEDGQNLLRLLQLADPEAFGHLERAGELSALMDLQPGIEALLRALRDSRVSGADVLSKWESLRIEDAELTARFCSLIVGQTDSLVRHKLAAVLTDRYYPGARILRYQRKFLALDNDLPERVEEPIDYRPGPEELEVRRLVREWLAVIHRHGKSEDSAWQDAASVLIQATHSSPLAVEQWLLARQCKLKAHDGVTADPVLRNREKLEMLEVLEGAEPVVAKLREANLRWTRAARAADMKGRALARLTRYEALRDRLRSMLEAGGEPRRFLVFTSFECNVRPLYLLLRKELGEDTEVFFLSAELEWREREKNAFAFQECDAPCVLVSDELGGEGRNFQFADALFHFDLPLAPWIIEQRVGRLDRVGREQEMDVDSQVLVAPGMLDEALYEFHRDAVSVFNDSLAPVEDMMEQVTRQMIAACIDHYGEGVRSLVDEISGLLAHRREHEARGLLTRDHTGVEDVKQLVPLLDDSRELNRLRQAVTRYTTLLGSVVDDSSGKLSITVGSHHPLHALTGVLPEMQGHFDRTVAVRHERREFFSPGHPFVRALGRGALQESGDRAAFLIRDGVTKPAFVFSHRISMPTDFLEAVRELPGNIQPAILCAAGASFGTRMTAVAVDFSASVLTAPEDTARLLVPWEKSDLSLDAGSEIYGYLPEGWESLCRRAAQAAAERVSEQARGILAAGMARFQSVLSEVLTRQFGSEFPVESQIETLLFELDQLTVELDSATVVFPRR
ncbi:hypothetical protein HZA57_08290 [Candidatus Poribacteria bacterium]|nr:hypothetical protein [Candidatus Poribacteria bacterium]